jgi:glycosyltransferase involved in cell wall biosynthesis
MDSSPKIAILLATYNGAKFVAEQLDSLLAQSYSNFVIVTRDDGSTDATCSIVADYASRHPQLFYCLSNDGVNRGASASFSCLIEYVLQHKNELGLPKAYMMLCDQDDVWYPEKIAAQLDAILAAEVHAADALSAKQLPLLVHTDLEVVGEKLESIAPSLARFQGLEIGRNSFPDLVISNLVTGCTALFNEELASKLVPIPDDAIMHDWWLALGAAAFGELVFLNAPMVSYRQHGANTIGAKRHVKPTLLKRTFWRRLVEPRPNIHLLEVAEQARAFSRCFRSELSPRNRLALRLVTFMKIRSGLLQRILFYLARKL